ncbi:MAG: c-type cytochrome [Cocleimonas sp.]
MSNSHDKLPKFFWIQLALAALVGIIFLITFFQDGFEHDAVEKDSNIEKTSKNLKPIGAASTNDAQASSGSSKARSGKEVYNASCLACHATGVANAPKLDDKASWEPRVAAGLDSLMNTAINGKGAMPARGGNPAITDEEIKATIFYMVKAAGFDKSALSSEAEPSSNEATPKKTEEVPVPKAAETVSESIPAVAPKAVALAVAPTPPSAPAAPTEPNAITTADETTTPETAIETETKTEEVPKVEEATEKVVADNGEGKKVYKQSCSACHDSGVAGSPKLDDKAAWVPRIATGIEALYGTALKGKGAMPAKGGNMGLSDDAVKAAVDYMVSQSQ